MLLWCLEVGRWSILVVVDLGKHRQRRAESRRRLRRSSPGRGPGGGRHGRGGRHFLAGHLTGRIWTRRRADDCRCPLGTEGWKMMGELRVCRERRGIGQANLGEPGSWVSCWRVGGLTLPSAARISASSPTRGLAKAFYRRQNDGGGRLLGDAGEPSKRSGGHGGMPGAR